MENPISVKKDLVSENQNYDEFSKSKEEAIKYCLELMGPNDTKKRKFDSELPVEKALPLEEVRQKIIEKLSIYGRFSAKINHSARPKSPKI